MASRVADPSSESARWQLSGSDEADFETIARTLAAVSSEPVRYVDICRPEAEGLQEARGLPIAHVRQLTEYGDFLVSKVVCTGCCDTAARLLGRAPGSLRNYLGRLARELRSIEVVVA